MPIFIYKKSKIKKLNLSKTKKRWVNYEVNLGQNYNRGSSNLGYGPNIGPSSNNYNNPPNNQYSTFGYGNNPTQNVVNPNINMQTRQSTTVQNQQSSWGNPELRA